MQVTGDLETIFKKAALKSNIGQRRERERGEINVLRLPGKTYSAVTSQLLFCSYLVKYAIIAPNKTIDTALTFILSILL